MLLETNTLERILDCLIHIVNNDLLPRKEIELSINRLIKPIQTWAKNTIYEVRHKSGEVSVYFTFETGIIRIHKGNNVCRILLYQPVNMKPQSCIYNRDNPFSYAQYMKYCINYLNDPIDSILDNIKIEKSSALFDTLDRLTNKQYI